ncbi:MAG: DUF4124 domain-containing protein [Proteobacteria bacterium]|nr:DUF4124 domain-containing protein [Pseudomonadota bacterium]
MRASHLGALLAGMLVCATSGSSQAEIYRCKTADGSIVYTSDRSGCPSGSSRVEPRRAIQRFDGPPAASGSSKRPAKASSTDDPAFEERWRGKYTATVDQLRNLERAIQNHRETLGNANCREVAVVRGVKRRRDLPDVCRLRSEILRLESRRDYLRNYLENELPEECRRAGCLPGWVR